jgi:hypothetical protein
MSKAFGEQNPTQGEDPVSWQTFTNGAGIIPDVVGDVDWGKLKLDLLGQEGRSAVYDLGAAATRKFTLTENRYGSGAETATIQIRGDTSAFVQDDVLPAWETYTAPVSKGYRYVQVRATTVSLGWWLSGGITPANCIAAYQAKGAATYAASKVNLANPSTYDAVDGAAYPTWAAETGWTFDGATTFLTCSKTVFEPITIIARVVRSASVSERAIIGSNQDNGWEFRLKTNHKTELLKSSVVSIGESTTAIDTDDTVAVSYAADGTFVFYLNGGADGNGVNDQPCPTFATFRIGQNQGSEWFGTSIYCVSMYDIVLSAPEILAVSNAMAAL